MLWEAKENFVGITGSGRKIIILSWAVSKLLNLLVYGDEYIRGCLDKKI